MDLRLRDFIDCNPQVKLKKGELYPLIDIDSITIGERTPIAKEDVVFNGQSGSRFQDRDTIMARITPCLENGKIAQVRTDAKACIGSTELFVFRGIKNISDNDFVFYFMKQKWIRDLAANSMTGASGRQRADLGFIKKIKCKFPSLPNQQKIASILNNYDQLIENNNKRIKLLEDMAESIYKEWFVRFRFPGYKTVDNKIQSAKGWTYGDREKGQSIPKKWQFGELKIIAEFRRGKNITTSEMKEGVIPVIAAGLEPSGYHDEANVNGYSLTISASGANAGYLAYHLEDIWAADCSYYQSNTNLWFVFNALKFLQPVISNMQNGSAQPHVYPKNINRISTIIPTDKLIEKFVDKVSPIYEEIRLLNDQNNLLVKQRDSLLPRLMSGKLSVEGKEVTQHA